MLSSLAMQPYRPYITGRCCPNLCGGLTPKPLCPKIATETCDDAEWQARPYSPIADKIQHQPREETPESIPMAVMSVNMHRVSLLGLGGLNYTTGLHEQRDSAQCYLLLQGKSDLVVGAGYRPVVCLGLTYEPQKCQARP